MTILNFMYQKVKTTTREFWKTAIIVVVTIFLAGAASAQNKQSDIVGVWDGWCEANQGKAKLKLTINDDMSGMFEITNMPGMSNVFPGRYSIVVDYYNGSYLIIGKEWVERHPMCVFLNLIGKIKNEKFNGKTEQGKQFKLERIATAQQLQEQQTEQEKQLQAQKAKQEKDTLFIFIGLGAFIILVIVIAIRSQLKANERRKEYQPIFVEIFKERGFSATDIIWTNCQYKIKDYVGVNNIVFGVKNGVLSFFGGGTSMVNWRKLLKENGDFLLSDGSVAKTLFPKHDNYKFRHLFDIPIHSIENFEGKQKGKEVELLIEYSDDSLGKLLPDCGNVNPNIEIINAIIGAFNKIMENNTLSKTRISIINDEICEAIKEDDDMTRSKQNQQNKQTSGCIGGIFLLILSIVTFGAVSGVRNWSNDR